jgi:hypothetical protein
MVPGQPEKEIIAADALAIQNALKRQGFHGHAIAIAAAEEILLRGDLEVPLQGRRGAAEQIIRMERCVCRMSPRILLKWCIGS